MSQISVKQFIAPISVWMLSAVLLLGGAIFLPRSQEVAGQVLQGLASLGPVIIVAALLAGWLAVSEVAFHIPCILAGSTARAAIIGSAAGAVTPVCGLGILPLISTLQRHGVATPAIMAFLLSAPVTDPAMMVVTAGVFGIPFAIAKTFAAFAVGIGGGILVASLDIQHPPVPRRMRQNQACSRITDVASRSRRQFVIEVITNGELALRWLTFALILEIWIRHWIPQAWVTASVGAGTWWGIPVAASLGAPLYFDGYAALPLVHGFTQLGMSSGAALALLISGSAVSLYSAIAVFSLLPIRVFLLYLGAAVIGAMVCGYVAQGLGLAVVA